MMANILVLAAILVSVIGAISKIVVDRKNGIMCTGCPHSKVCASQNTGQNQQTLCSIEKR